MKHFFYKTLKKQVEADGFRLVDYMKDEQDGLISICARSLKRKNSAKEYLRYRDMSCGNYYRIK